LLFDPEDVGAIARAIETLIHDPAARERLRVSGPQRARQFSWRRAAQQTVVSYGRALGSA
jgi:glycosyltransferase involved in cell wall biosynthesis